MSYRLDQRGKKPKHFAWQNLATWEPDKRFEVGDCQDLCWQPSKLKSKQLHCRQVQRPDLCSEAAEESLFALFHVAFSTFELFRHMLDALFRNPWAWGGGCRRLGQDQRKSGVWAVGGSLGAPKSGSLRAPESGSLGTPKSDIRDT